MPRSCPTLSKDQRIISVLVHSMGTCVCNSKEQQKGTLLTALLERDWRCKKVDLSGGTTECITSLYSYLHHNHHNCNSKIRVYCFLFLGYLRSASTASEVTEVT